MSDEEDDEEPSNNSGIDKELGDLNKSSMYYHDLKLSESYNFAEFNPLEQLKETPNFACLITSKRRTGKSVLMRDMVSKIKNWYDETYVFSLTVKYQPKLFDFVHEDNVYSTFNEEVLKDLWTSQEKHILKLEAQGKAKEKHAKKILILFDDVISDKRVRNSEILNRYAVAGRHLMFCFILISQTVTGVPPIIRTQADVAIAFYLDSYKNRETYAGEYLSTKTKRVGMMIFNKITKKPYQAIVCLNIITSQNPEETVFTYNAELKIPKFKMKSSMSRVPSKITTQLGNAVNFMPRISEEY